MIKRNPWRRIYDHPQSLDPHKNGIPEFALYLDVEPTNVCMFDCLFCARQQMKRPLGYMNMDMCEEICRQAELFGCMGIRYLRWGEPLMHPRIDEMVEIAKDHNLLTHITTNGYMLAEPMCHRLIDAGLDSIIISLQGTTGEEYNNVRNTDVYNKIEGNIEQLMSIKEGGLPWVHVSTTVTDESDKQIKEWENKWNGIVDSTGWGYTWFKRLKNKERVEDLIKRAKALPHHFKCIEVMNKLSIDLDGTVSPCCLDYDQQLSIGNIKETDLMTLWKSPQANAIRTLLGQKRQDILVLCSGCELNYAFRGKK
jgi:radical SAM protein with 4Fe4S-binding SPASM domain